eukprot:1123163-Rhodomonas_salina.1
MRCPVSTQGRGGVGSATTPQKKGKARHPAWDKVRRMLCTTPQYNCTAIRAPARLWDLARTTCPEARISRDVLTST